MTTLRTILLAEDSPADAEMAIDALEEARLANPIVHVEDGVEVMDYLLRRGEVPVAVHPPLAVARWRTACALSPQAGVALAELDAALAAMQADGSLARIVDRYR